MQDFRAELAKLKAKLDAEGQNAKPQPSRAVSQERLQAVIGPAAKAGELGSKEVDRLRIDLAEHEQERIIESFIQLRDAQGHVQQQQAEDALNGYGNDALSMALGHVRLFSLDRADEMRRFVALLSKLANRSQEGRQILLDALESTIPTRRRLAAIVLGSINEVNAVPALRRMMMQPEAWYEAAAALLDLRDQGSAELVAKALGAINPASKTDLDLGWRISQRMSSLGDAAVAPLVKEYLACQKRQVRTLLARAITGLNALAVNALVEVMADDDDQVARDATLALGEIGTPEAATHLLDSIRDGRGNPRYALEALGRVGKRREIPSTLFRIAAFLTEYMNGAHQPGLKGAALIALANVAGPKALPLIQQHEVPDSPIRAEAAFARARLHDPKGVADLIHLALENRNGETAARFLGACGSEAIKALSALASGGSPEEARLAARVLQRMRDVPATTVSDLKAKLAAASDDLRLELYYFLAKHEPFSLYHYREQETNYRLKQSLNKLIESLPKEFGKPTDGRQSRGQS